MRKLIATRREAKRAEQKPAGAGEGMQN
jgi:hypothetical protein